MIGARSHVPTAVTARLEELERRVHRDPASIAFAALAEEYRRLGLFQDAIEVCRSGLHRHSSYLSARVTLGRALLELGELDDASFELERVLQVAPENLAAIRALAEIHRRRGEMPETSFPVAPIAVESQANVCPDPPALAGLEEFLAAIQRVRRESIPQAAR